MKCKKHFALGNVQMLNVVCILLIWWCTKTLTKADRCVVLTQKSRNWIPMKGTECSSQPYFFWDGKLDNTRPYPPPPPHSIHVLYVCKYTQFSIITSSNRGQHTALCHKINPQKSQHWSKIVLLVCSSLHPRVALILAENYTLESENLKMLPLPSCANSQKILREKRRHLSLLVGLPTFWSWYCQFRQYGTRPTFIQFECPALE